MTTRVRRSSIEAPCVSGARTIDEARPARIAALRKVDSARPRFHKLRPSGQACKPRPLSLMASFDTLLRLVASSSGHALRLRLAPQDCRPTDVRLMANSNLEGRKQRELSFCHSWRRHGFQRRLRWTSVRSGERRRGYRRRRRPRRNERRRHRWNHGRRHGWRHRIRHRWPVRERWWRRRRTA